MLRQIGWGLQNGPITKSKVFEVITLLFEKCVSVRQPFIKGWFDVPSTSRSIVILFVSAGALFEDVFSLWVFLRQKQTQILL